MNLFRNAKSQGFTVVELLIVIVVIAIIAAVTVVAYNGVTGQTQESAMKTSLRTAADKVTLERRSGPYPNNLDAVGIDTDQDGFTLSYSRGSGGRSYCLQAVSDRDGAKSFYISNETKSIEEGDCSIVTNIANNAPIQNITQSQCQALPTYTGSNESAIRTIRDTRGGTTRNYRMAKLADGNCWMLDNLKLGSTTGSITLKPSDSNVASNFTLPRVAVPPSTSQDNPYAIGPVPGDGTGANNYGYLYNWPAATAGESRTSFPAYSGNAPYSICPAGWRLPTGGATGEFAMLNAKMNNPNATTPSITSGAGFRENWQYTGPFKGVFAGRWNGSFHTVGTYGNLWSSSALASRDTEAQFASFYASGANPAYFDYRYAGFGVRCILN